MKKILILQNKILHYNKPLYNYLAKKYKVTVVHSGNISKFKDDIYTELIVNSTNVGPFIFQHKVISEVRSLKYDVVIGMFDIKWINNILALYIKHAKTKYIWWGHGYGKNNVGNYIRNFLIRKSDALLLYSNRDLSILTKNGIDNSKIFIAENTLEVKNHEFNQNIKRDSFLFVGRAQKRKKVEDLFIAFSKIIASLPNNVFIKIVGDGVENKTLKELSEKLNIEDRVEFLGSITDEVKLKSVFQGSLAYISPGHVGLGVLHSFAYGVPVVTIEHDSHAPEFGNINNMNSIVYDGSIEKLSIILKELVINKEKSYQLGKNAYNHYSKYRTMNLMVEGFINAIEYSGEKNDF